MTDEKETEKKDNSAIKTGKKLKVDADSCIGCGNCAQLYSDVFEIGDDGYSHVKNENPENAEDMIEEISCPVNAITFE